MHTNFSTKTLFVGVDIGKNVHCYGGYRGEKMEIVGKVGEVRSNREGYEEFRQWLRGEIGRASCRERVYLCV